MALQAQILVPNRGFGIFLGRALETAVALSIRIYRPVKVGDDPVGPVGSASISQRISVRLA